MLERSSSQHIIWKVRERREKEKEKEKDNGVSQIGWELFLVIFLLKFLCLPAMCFFFVRECRGAEPMFDFLKRCAVPGALKGHLF